MQKTLIKSLLLIIAFTFALSANYIFAVWTGPTQAPPGGNTPTPVHVGATDQVKDAGLSLNSLAVFGNGFFDGNVGIGTANPSAGGEQPLKLDVEGAIGAKFYCDENGNNCFSAPLGGGGNSIAFLANKNGIDQLVLSPNNIIEWDKITFASEEFDIGNYYNNATSRYTPPAGIYYIGGSYTQTNGPRDMLIALHKNGVKIKEDYGNSNSGAGGSVPFGVVVSVNGTDYLELYAGFGANTVILGDSTKTYFYGFKLANSDTGGGGSGWVDITSDTGNFDTQCEYRFKATSEGYYFEDYFYATLVQDARIVMAWGENEGFTVLSTNKASADGSIGIIPVRTYERCGGGGGSSGSLSFGNWETKAINTTYKATSDGFVVTANTPPSGVHYGYTDGNSNPTTLRTVNDSQGDGEGIMMPVKSGDYWRVYQPTPIGTYNNVYWLPVVSGGGSLNSTTFTNPTKTLSGTPYSLCLTVAGDTASIQMTTINQFCSEKGYEFGEVFDLSTNAGNYAYYYNSSWINNSCGAKALSVKCFK